MEKSVAMTVTNEKVSNHIPDDIALSIMSKLPIKSLKRFGCVRKSWDLLFENPLFKNMYCNNFSYNNHRYSDGTSLLLRQTITRGFDFSYHDFQFELHSLSGERFENRVKLDWPDPFQEDVSGFYILGTCSVNGILCLYCHIRADTRFVLWNPATEEFKVIPLSLVESVANRKVYVDPHGFGYDHVRDDYKVIRHVSFFPLAGSFWEIYSLRSNSWRKLDVDRPNLNREIEGSRVYMDGVCHWWGVNGTHGVYLVSFNLINEVFFTTPIPSDISDSFDFGLAWWKVWRHLVVLNGSISLISYYPKATIFHISILGKLGVKESWIKIFTVGPLSCVEHPIGVGKNGDIFFRRENDEVAWFDLSTQMTKELGIKGERFCCQIVIYKKSLLPIGGIND